LLESPRQRRRLAWLAGFLGVAAIAAVVAYLVPNYSGNVPQKFSNQPVQRVISQKSVPVTLARRAQVNALFDAFVPAAIERKDPVAAYDLLTTEGRSGQTRNDFRHGKLPVLAYDAKGATFHGWSVDDSYRDQMDVQLYLQPASPKDGPIDYAVGLKRERGRWLIDSIYARASYGSSAPAEASGGGSASAKPGPTGPPQGKTGLAWALIIVLVGAVAAVPAVFFAAQWRSNRRNRRGRFAD
jgi:hypothetical protein